MATFELQRHKAVNFNACKNPCAKTSCDTMKLASCCSGSHCRLKALVLQDESVELAIQGHCVIPSQQLKSTQKAEQLTSHDFFPFPPVMELRKAPPT